MTILQIHNYYIKDGGEFNLVVETERKLLQQKGHEVITYTKDNHDLSYHWEDLDRFIFALVK